jgi:hypothetical protein
VFNFAVGNSKQQTNKIKKYERTEEFFDGAQMHQGCKGEA